MLENVSPALKDKLMKVCKICQHGCCRYLTASAEGFECALHMKTTEAKDQIDRNVAMGLYNAIDINCEGDDLLALDKVES